MSFRSFVKRTPGLRTLAYWAFTANKKGLLNPLVLGRTLGYMPRFMGQLRELKADAESRGVAIKIKDVFPVALDYSVNHVNRHYWFQDIHVAQKVIDGSRGRPDHLHIDIGSRIEGFILALIAARINLVFGELNMPKIAFENTELRFIDLQNMTPEQFEGATSVSCLHVIEHLGLGKYGDTIDVLGHYKVFSDFARVLKPGVPLYISSPTSSEPGIVFNAGRHLDPVEMYKEAERAGFVVLEKAFVTSAWSLLIDPSDEQMQADPYGCLILSLIRQ